MKLRSPSRKRPVRKIPNPKKTASVRAGIQVNSTVHSGQEVLSRDAQLRKRARELMGNRDGYRILAQEFGLASDTVRKALTGMSLLRPRTETLTPKPKVLDPNRLSPQIKDAFLRDFHLGKLSDSQLFEKYPGLTDSKFYNITGRVRRK